MVRSSLATLGPWGWSLFDSFSHSKLNQMTPLLEFCCEMFFFSIFLTDLEGPQPEGPEWADGSPGWEQWLWEKHNGPADTKALRP